MKSSLFTLLIFITSLQLGYSQNAKTILDKASDAYSKANGLTASFSLDVKDVKNKSTYSQDGTAYMKGDKFKIDIVDGITWFNGKTQWVLSKDLDEVNISDPSEDELKAISPLAMFNIYKSGFDLKYKGEKIVNNKTVMEVDMIPQKKNEEITKIIIQVDKATNIFSKIIIANKSGLTNEVSIHNIKMNVNIPNETFQFNKAEYPNVEIIDLR